MKINGLQKLSLLDYPQKTACTVFLSSCNMRCPFCHNAPLVIGPIDHDIIPEEELFAFLEKRRGILDGVTITGGEPTLNAELPEFISKIKKLGFLVKLDTNGTNPEMLSALISAKLIDYIAMDIKSSPRNYQTAAGAAVNLDNIKKSVEIIKNSRLDYEFRTTIVGSLHNMDDITAIGKWLDGADKYYLQRFADGENVLRKDLRAADDEFFSDAVIVLKPYFKTVEVRG